MNPKCSVPIGLLKLPGMNAIQAALQPRTAGAVPSGAGWQRGVVPTSQPRGAALMGARPGAMQAVATGSGNVENQLHNTASSGAKGIKSAPTASSFLRHSALNFPKA